MAGAVLTKSFFFQQSLTWEIKMCKAIILEKVNILLKQHVNILRNLLT